MNLNLGFIIHICYVQQTVRTNFLARFFHFLLADKKTTTFAGSTFYFYAYFFV